MDRVAEERQYVLEILCRMRQEVGVNPDLFESDALAHIEETISLLQAQGEKADAVSSGKQQLGNFRHSCECHGSHRQRSTQYVGCFLRIL